MRARDRKIDQEHNEKVSNHLLGSDDLYAKCRKCKQRIVGSLDKLKKHVEDCK